MKCPEIFRSVSYVSLMLALFLGSFSASAAKHPEEVEFNTTEMIMHHISDAHEFHLWGEGDDAVSVPLPVILYSPDKGLTTCMSSAFEHGHKTVDGYQLTHSGQIINEKGMHSVKAFDLFGDTPIAFIDLSITKNVFALLFSTLILLLVFGAVASSYKKRKMQAPKGLQSAMEPLILFVRDEIAISNIGKEKHKKFMPFLLTVFFFIWLNNLLGLVPFFPGSANLTGNIGFTFVLALATFIITNINGNKHYWKHVFATPGVPVPLLIIMIPVEIIGLFTKPFALMVRLFANITAGHIIILSLISLIFAFKNAGWAGLSVPMALFMNTLELLVAFIQAYVFTLLSALFIGAAVEEEHH